MAKKFYDIDEAAGVLGVSPGELNDMRTRNEIRGFRDGTTWKFRAEEVEKVAGDLKNKPVAEDDEELSLADDVGEGEGGSVLLSERELGSAPTTSSTIIGKSSSRSSSESDIRLADSSRDNAAAGASDVKLASASGVLSSEAPIVVSGGSAAGSGVGGTSGMGSDLGLQFEELDSLELEFGEGSGTGSQVEKASEKAAAPAGPSDSTLSLGDDEAPVGSASGSKKAGGSDVGGSALDLSGDDDLVLGGSGSDITTKPGDSGISLMDPSDSGLSLDEPLELGGSQIDGGSLVLGEDDMITLGGSEIPDVSAATQLRSDDDFQLTPSKKSSDESESGSQVIALDSIEGFDEDAATQVGTPAGMRMLEADDSADTMVGGPGMVPAGAMAGAPGMMMAPAIPEAPYSVWNLLAMFACIAVLCLIGMMMADLVRNMWGWEQGYSVNSGLMDSLIEMFGGKK